MPVIVVPCLVETTAERGFARRSAPTRGEKRQQRPWVVVTPQRLQGLPTIPVLARDFPFASTRCARLLGLSHLDLDAAGPGLLIPSCRSIHTFGMRFALDLVFLERDGRPCSVRRGVPPRRLAWDWRASAVLELPANSELCAS
jgi:hypothetical protein